LKLTPVHTAIDIGIKVLSNHRLRPLLPHRYFTSSWAALGKIATTKDSIGS